MSDPVPEDPLDAPQSSLIATFYRYRKLLTAVGLTWFAAIVAGGMFLSHLDVQYGLHVFGPPAWIAGQRAVIRVGLRDLEWRKFQRVGPIEVVFRTPEGVDGPAQTLSPGATEFEQGAVDVPRKPGLWRLALKTTFDGKRVQAEIPILVQAEAPAPELPPPFKHALPVPPDTGPRKLEITPLDGLMPGGLPGALAVRATDTAGRPLSVPVDVKLEKGRSAVPVPPRITTDADGLADFPVLPQMPTLKLTLTSEGSKAVRTVFHRPTQFAVAAPGPFVTPGTELTLGVISLHRTGDVFLDAWHGEQWVQSTSAVLENGQATMKLVVPELPEDPAVLWVQAYRTTYMPGRARGGLHLLVTRRPPAEAVAHLAKRLVAAGIDADYARQVAARPSGSRRLARFLLGRLGRPDREPALLADSSVTAERYVDDLRTRWQRRFVLALAVSGGLLFAMIAFLLTVNYRDVQRRWSQTEAAAEGLKGTRQRFFLEAGYMFVVLALFILGVIQLLLTIRW